MCLAVSIVACLTVMCKTSQHKNVICLLTFLFTSSLTIEYCICYDLGEVKIISSHIGEYKNPLQNPTNARDFFYFAIEALISTVIKPFLD